MSSNFMQYSNGYGHLAVTLAIIASMTVLLVFHAIDVAVFASVVSPVIGFWFLSGAANRFNPAPNPTAQKENNNSDTSS